MPQLRLANLLPVSTAEPLAPPRLSAPARTRTATPPQRQPATSCRFYLILAAFALAVAAASLLIPSTPSYDPWAWLVWGREILHLKLHTTAGPSWKPLPVIFTTVFAAFGNAAPDLWLVVARAGAVVGTVMCFRLAWRFTRRLSGAGGNSSGAARVARLLPSLMAGLIAAGTFVNSQGVLSGNALGYSEGLMTALVLIALERHLDGARRQAFVVGFFACLDRPELWLLWVPYGLYLWRQDRAARKLVASLFALIPVLWFLPELWGSGHLFRSIARAQTPRSNSPAYAKCPFCTEFDKHAWTSALPRVEVAALAAMGVAVFGLWRARASRWWREAAAPALSAQAVLLAIGLVGFVWWLGVALETQLGFSGNDRYLELGTALVGVAGGVGWAWAGRGAARLVRSIAPARRSVAVLGGVILAVAAFIAVPPWIARKGVLSIPATHGALIYQARLREDLGKVVGELGGPARILRCGSVMTEGFQVPMVAWMLGVHMIRIEAPPGSTANPGPAPNVVFQTRATGTAFLLPILRGWKGVRYQLVAHARTFSVYSSCAGRVTL